MIKIGDFKVNITPPVGACVGFGHKAESIRDPLFARGIILDDEISRIAIVSLDYCVLVHSAYEELRSALARAVGTIPDQVVIHCIHQHDAPLVDFEAAKYLHVADDYCWWQEVVANCSRAAGKAANNLHRVAIVGTASYLVNGYASNRRVVMPDGTLVTRYSRCADEKIRNAPVGNIDPFLRTVAFGAEDGEILASMSFYATHPQVANTNDKFSADAPGETMRLLGDNNGMNVFFTGCGGNVTAGKYSSLDTEANLVVFGKKLADAIENNINNLDWQFVDNIGWQSNSFEFPRRKLDRKQLLEKMQENPNDASSAALLGVMDFKTFQYTLYKLKLGDITMFFLPSELFVEYQLYINSLYPDDFVAVAANCRDDFFYCPLASDFKHSEGYETNNFCYTSEEFEEKFKTAAKKLAKKR